MKFANVIRLCGTCSSHMPPYTCINILKNKLFYQLCRCFIMLKTSTLTSADVASFTVTRAIVCGLFPDTCGDEKGKTKITQSEDPREMKRIGRTLKNFSYTTWITQCIDVVRDGNIAKVNGWQTIKQLSFIYTYMCKVFIAVSTSIRVFCCVFVLFGLYTNNNSYMYRHLHQ